MVSNSRRSQEYHSCYRIHKCHHCRFVPLPEPSSLLVLLHPPSFIYIYIAACCNEAFKIATSSAAYLNNYFMLIGTDGVYSYTFEHEKRDDCPVCGNEALEMTINGESTVEQLIELLVEKQDMYVTFLHRYIISSLLQWQSNQEAIIIDANEADLFAGTTTTRRSYAPKFGKESVRISATRRRSYCHSQHLAIQPVPSHFIFNIIKYRSCSYILRIVILQKIST